MTLIVIEYPDTDRSALFQDERLAAIQHLLSQGCHGDLMLDAVSKPDSLWEVLSPVIENARLLQISLPTAEPAGWEQAAELIASQAMDYLHLDIAGAPDEDKAGHDAAISSFLAHLTEDDVLALIAGAPSGAAYLIVAEGNPLNGAASPAAVTDVALTLLALMGRQRPDGIKGQALVSGPPAVKAETDEDAELRERFRGLGYIA